MNPDLVDMVENFIDMSQKNKFNQSQFVGEWTLSKVYKDTYVDGQLTKSEDVTSYYAAHEYTFNDNGTMRYSSTTGKWTYAHNFLIWSNQGIFSYEVVDVNADKLVYRNQNIPLGGYYVNYYKDKRGTHLFTVYEYTRK